jgi:Zn-dependent M16 (insulinase) family peptidase
MADASVIESAIEATFEDVAVTGFDADRIDAILHRTELALKKQVHAVSRTPGGRGGGEGGSVSRKVKFS